MRTKPAPMNRDAFVNEIIPCRMKRKTIPLSLLCLPILAISATLAAAESSITFYRDGALYRQEAVAAGGIIDVPLAADLLEHTLTVVPEAGTTILGVETGTRGSANRPAREIEALTEQRRRLEDRLQALEAREAIFVAAAKAQSGKAPRKSKSNPDPMQAIRQGTDFAIAQLEAVYTARRTATQEIRKIDARLAGTGRGGRPADNSVRIAVSPGRGRVTLRYATAEPGWQPQYSLHLTGDGTAQLHLSARITGNGRGHQIRISPGSLAEAGTAETFPARPVGAVLARYPVPLTEELHAGWVYNRFSGVITNSTPHYLPPGESGLFRGGTYLGKFRFEGISSGRSRVISMGK